MNCSYESIYESYVSFCKNIDVCPLSFEMWMEKRGDVVEHKIEDEADKILNESL